MLRRVKRFLKDYRQLSFAIVIAITGAALDLASRDLAAHWILASGALLVTIPLLIDMIKTLRSGQFGIDLLALVAIVTSVILQQYWAALVIVLMLTGGESLEKYAEGRAKNELNSLLNHRPKIAHLIKKQARVDIKVSDIVIGDELEILAGEVIPVDAVILEGESSVDESSITGESVPIIKRAGENVLSGSINIEGVLIIRAHHAAADSQYEQIIKLVRGALASKSPFVRLADTYSIPFTAVSFFIAGATWIVTGEAIRFLEVLVVATPCPLLLGAPIALISGMSRAAKHGIIIKSGVRLEQLADIETVAFDKTGTLTQGRPVVNTVTSYGKFSKEDVVQAAAALEQSSSHILAQAIVGYAGDHKISYQRAKQVKETAGHGLSGRLMGKHILVGHRSLIIESGIDMPKTLQGKAPKQTVTYVAIGGVLAGTITFKDSIRPEAALTLKNLRSLGIKNFALVTGDNEASAISIAQELDIRDVYPDCLPADKIHAVEAMSAPIAFVGDGVNDAPVLTAADVGIALGARGSTAASETADVVIMHDDISRVATSIAIAKRTLFIAKQSVLIGILISLGLMVIFATGKFTAVQGALVQEVVDVIVIINALRAHGGKLTVG